MALARIADGDFADDSGLNIPGLLDTDPSTPDLLAEGYVSSEPHFSLDDTVVRILKNDRGYNGIHTVLTLKKRSVSDHEVFVDTISPFGILRISSLRQFFDFDYSFSIPVNYAKKIISDYPGLPGKISGLKTEKEKFDFLSHFVDIELFPIHSLDQDHKNIYRFNGPTHGYSNPHIFVLPNKQGQCYNRAHVLTALSRYFGIKSRVAVYTYVPNEITEQAAIELGDFHFNCFQGYIGLKKIPEYLNHVARHENRDFGVNPDVNIQILMPYLLGKRPINLIPVVESLYNGYQLHVWTEALVEDGWTKHNSTDHRYQSQQPCPFDSKIFDLMQPHRILPRELRIVRGNDGNISCYFKNTDP
ncbi:MAG: transglutaminase-like domain-containing protein [Nanoarchaeota archaeon]